MVATIVPISPGYMKNFQLFGNGGKYNTVKCTFDQGFWSNNKLNSNDCTVTRYLPVDTVNIKRGVYTNSIPNGAILEYEFDKSLWATFTSNPDEGIDSTKYERTYSAGALVSTESTAAQKIKASISYNLSGGVITFVFSEVI